VRELREFDDLAERLKNEPMIERGEIAEDVKNY
jgi:hypothetical protein